MPVSALKKLDTSRLKIMSVNDNPELRDLMATNWLQMQASQSTFANDVPDNAPQNIYAAVKIITGFFGDDQRCRGQGRTPVRPSRLERPRFGAMGQIMAAALLATAPNFDAFDLDAAIAGNICRCGTGHDWPRVVASAKCDNAMFRL